MYKYRSIPASAAVVALAIATSAVAQTNLPPPAPAQNQNGTTTTPPVGSPAMRPGATTTAGTPIIAQQEAKEILARDLIGHTVVTSDGQEVGEIKDLILDKEGKVSGLVITVGGVLGIGGKKVGVATDATTLAARDEKSVMIKVSSNELASAPEFKTRAEFEEEMKSDRTAPGLPGTKPVR